jgi:hypothetical protein
MLVIASDGESCELGPLPPGAPGVGYAGWAAWTTWSGCSFVASSTVTES